jgi:hypothetical protein
MLTLLATTLLALSPATAADAEAPSEEIVVWGDLFARWDDTRWMVTTEMGVPYRFTFTKDENAEFRSREFQIRTIVRCNKEWKLGNHKYEVDCAIEDFGMQASIAEDRVKPADIERAQAVLDEIDAKLTGAALELHVADDGRVTDLALNGVPMDNRRQSDMQETLRQVMSRIIVGFNLKLQKYNQLHEGKWTEYNSTIMTIPLPAGVTGGGGSNVLVHYLNHYRGQVVVQSIGKGMVQVPFDNGFEANFTTDLIGVSLFDENEGFMTERVWALNGQSTASSFFDQGTYFHAGRIWMLGSEDKPDCGPTRVVNGRNGTTPDLPAWEPIER